MGQPGWDSSARAVTAGWALTGLQRLRSQPPMLPSGAEAETEVTLSKVPSAKWAHRGLSGWAAPRPSSSHGAWQAGSRGPSIPFHCLPPPGGAGWQIWVACLCPHPPGNIVLLLVQMSFLPHTHTLLSHTTPMAERRDTSRHESWTQIQEAESTPSARGQPM